VKTFWMIVAGVCIVVAAVFLLLGSMDAAFVVAVVGLIAWFLNHRMQMKSALAKQDAEEEKKEEENSDESD